MNIKSRITKLEGNLKPKQPCDEWDLSVLSVEELYRLEYLVAKHEGEITPDEYSELMNLCEKCRGKEIQTL